MKHTRQHGLKVVALTSLCALLPTTSVAQDVVISEISWMGTTSSSYDEWIELSNTTGNEIDLSGWTLQAADGTPSITLSGTIPANGFFLLERTDDSSVPSISADLIYSGSLSNGGEALTLQDAVSVIQDETATSWPEGNNSTKATMERVDYQSPGTSSSAWSTATASYGVGYGSPASASESGGSQPPMSPQDFIYDLKLAGGLTASSVTDPNSTPSSGSSLPMAQAMLQKINGADSSIDFSVYGFRNQCAFKDALVQAQQRGVVVRGYVDQESDGSYTYTDTNGCDTQAVMDALGSDGNGNAWVRFDLNDSSGKGYSAIMHNKFFVIDGEWVSVGSTNYSDTGIGGEYNANWNMLIQSTNLASVYQNEFDEMWEDGLSQGRKADNTVHVLPTYNDGTVIESYFSPTDDALNNAILPALNSADTTLDIAIFYMTSQEIADSIIAAKDRGAAVRVIIDATGASNAYSKHGDLCTAGIPVKIENWNGKMHMKALMADSTDLIIGSQNFTGAGNQSNDENTLWIKNGSMANIGAEYNAYFSSMWDSIPEQFNCTNPGAESSAVGQTCSDGKDNDYDGYVDGADFDCQ